MAGKIGTSVLRQRYPQFFEQRRPALLKRLPKRFLPPRTQRFAQLITHSFDPQSPLRIQTHPLILLKPSHSLHILFVPTKLFSILQVVHFPLDPDDSSSYQRVPTLNLHPVLFAIEKIMTLSFSWSALVIKFTTFLSKA